ncbi:MAG: hypothetical protein V4689_13070 [Verrucomicrobiota bacterium]
MNPVQRLSISFGAILLFGGLMFIYQTQRLGELERRAESRSAATMTDVPPLDGGPAPDSPGAVPAVKSTPAATDPAGEFIGKLKEALATSLTEEQVIAFLNMGGKGAAFESLAATANLTKEERDTIRQGLEQYDQERAALYLNRGLAPAALTAGLAEVKRRQEEWLAAQLGKERYEAVLRSDEQDTRASAERRAEQSVSRISSAADLTEAQKDKLYAGFLELNLHPPKTAEDKLVVETFGNLEMGPSAPDLSGDAERILTPKQRQLYQLQREASAQNTAAQSEMIMGLMESLMPAVMGLLETDH